MAQLRAGGEDEGGMGVVTCVSGCRWHESNHDADAQSVTAVGDGVVIQSG